MERGFASLNKFTSSKEKNISVYNLIVIFFHVVKGLSYLKSIRIAHLDIKPGNIMIDKDRKRAKLIDFGISQTELSFRKDYSSGTEIYMAPEIKESRNAKFSFGEFEEMIACDIFSLGKTFKKSSAFPETPEDDAILAELSDFVNKELIIDNPKVRKNLEETF